MAGMMGEEREGGGCFKLQGLLAFGSSSPVPQFRLGPWYRHWAMVGVDVSRVAPFRTRGIVGSGTDGLDFISPHPTLAASPLQAPLACVVPSPLHRRRLALPLPIPLPSRYPLQRIQLPRGEGRKPLPDTCSPFISMPPPPPSSSPSTPLGERARQLAAKGVDAGRGGGRSRQAI
uniref:Uncharacterized protein n=1 Tax=Oryza glumipatula TaxID=40148 RepID=A0A0D9ZI92_9ORYZ